MLLGIHPLLRGSLLAALDDMGHGDVLLIADANFPAHRISPRVIDLSGVDAPTAFRAIASVFPLDAAESLSLMASPHGTVPVQRDLAEVGAAHGITSVSELDRFDFYEAAMAASVVVLTGELRSYGNLLAVKGVVS